MTFNVNKVRKDMMRYKMTQKLDKVKTDKVRGPKSKLVTNGPEAQNEK